MEQILSEIIHKINPFDDFDEDTDLLGEGILDSLSLMVFVEEIEQKMGISIPEEKINLESFYSINSIIQLMNSLR